MALVLAFPATRLEPAEYKSLDPVYCAHCHQEWDEDDHRDEFTEVDGAIYCNETCLRIARLEAIRTEAKHRLATALEELIARAYSLSREYGEVDEDEHARPISILEDAAEHLDGFIHNYPTGYRDGGIMLSVVEKDKIERSLKECLERDYRELTAKPHLGYMIAPRMARAGVSLMMLDNQTRESQGQEAKWSL
jgi:hypothetical protein